MPGPIAIEDFAQSLPAKARLIGVDLGAKTIGLAISDVERRLASPLRTLPRGAFARDAEALTAVFGEFEYRGHRPRTAPRSRRSGQPPRAIDSGFRPQSVKADQSADRILG